MSPLMPAPARRLPLAGLWGIMRRLDNRPRGSASMTEYVRNCWYAAAWNHEVGREPLARTFLDEPVVLYRTAD